METTNDRLKKQINFVIEIDKLKNIYRQTLLMDGKRYENDAEHSWHLGLMVLLFSEYAAGKNIDLFRVIKMVLIHDLVEIDAGDTFCYDKKAALDKNEREQRAADRIFSILPADQSMEFRSLWEEFERMVTPESRFAAALDRFQPLLHNYNTQGAAWKKHGVSSDSVLERNKHIVNGAPELWMFAKTLIEDAVRKGYLRR
ncbi:MAG: HD domain-containing protein [Kiritimatiellae bacterium]|nr:HD domain-containing protein [Kiritimatiellia bacterium]